MKFTKSYISKYKENSGGKKVHVDFISSLFLLSNPRGLA